MFRYKSNSRENQDLFILAVLNKKRNGTYLEIGANHPIVDNNTFLLESQFGWEGVSVELDVSMGNMFNILRKNPCVIADATQLDYTALLQSCNLPKHIDFLQLDIDPPRNTFQALQRIDFSDYSFSIITYEHDLYAGGAVEREESRKILASHGYSRIMSDVMHDNLPFEDWYVNESYMMDSTWKHFVGSNVAMNTHSLSQNHINVFHTL